MIASKRLGRNGRAWCSILKIEITAMYLDFASELSMMAINHAPSLLSSNAGHHFCWNDVPLEGCGETDGGGRVSDTGKQGVRGGAGGLQQHDYDAPTIDCPLLHGGWGDAGDFPGGG